MAKQMRKAEIRPKDVLTLGALLVMALGCFVFRIPSVAAYTPTDPEDNSALKFLNATSATQQKAGSLTIGLYGDNAKLCLNANTNYPANDSKNCISSWAELSGGTTGALPLHTSGTYNPDHGYISLAPLTTTNQLYTLITQANINSFSPSTGLMATDAGSTKNYAGAFSGTVAVYDGSYGSSKQLCLNDPTQTAGIILGPFWGGSNSYGCITKWTDLFYPAGGQAYVNLTSSGSTPTRQNGLVAVSNSAQFGSMQIGDPDGTSLSYTCGDGICNAGETTASCRIDCASVVGMTSLTAYPGNGRVYFIANSWSSRSAGTQSVVVLRKLGSAPTAVPQNGSNKSSSALTRVRFTAARASRGRSTPG